MNSSTSLVLMGVKVDNTMRLRLTPIRNTIVMKFDNKNGGDMGNAQRIFILVGV